MGHEDSSVSVTPDSSRSDTITDFSDSPASTRAQWTRRLIELTALWALIELPVEYAGTGDDAERIALALSAAIWLLLAFFSIRGSAAARATYAFLCVSSVLAIVPALPAEFATFRAAFWLSLVECVLKSVFFAGLMSRHTQNSA